MRKDEVGDYGQNEIVRSGGRKIRGIKRCWKEEDFEADAGMKLRGPQIQKKN